jgi:pimeloyl-ACP methyl ester carboxylesterase
MQKQLRVIFIHGVGQQTQSFADDARTNLRRACIERDVAPFFLSCHWAPLADKLQSAYLAAVMSGGSEGNLSQKLVIGTLADALAYQSNEELRARIWDLLDRQAECFTGHPFTVISHSLGGLIATDWLRQRPRYQNVRLVSMACNIGLFTLGERFEPVPQLAKPGRWLNCWDKDDMLGFPLDVPPGTLPSVHDHEVRVGSLWNRWNGLVHLGYWGDRKLFRKTIPKLLGL